ncbi:carboxypeptidase-like regulatory domain-containing protein [Neolewinella aurantiaca]|uniref:Carboxypeptidase-like regulatory domain-containing protein n=1 Tax=Neolewinella aurantiaca TaxID=2602767 RepID=A0A5C7FMV6_9BACT|nr:carboxypeptidase-like regulatory domain-containing protein [Neolewinella aurantiaca]TXF91472.1 carboxypeptidase-like regulatory domain-containing protein [Neolewinella aurantiaca]
MSQRFFIFLVLILSWYPLSAQSTIKGRVLDVNESAVGYATVSLSTPDFKRILAYTSSDEQGVFILSTDTLPAWLIVSYLGRRPDTSKVNVAGEIDPIILTAEGTNLPDIVVLGAQEAMTQRDDTTTYDLSDFRDSTDNRLEDVLRRLPGIEVDDTGSIKVHGKPIHRITIEGSDLFGRDYQKASRNFRAKDIGTVEAIDHFEDNPVLKSVNNSEAVVLNLKLEEDVKSVLGGNLIVGAGYGENIKHHNNATLFKVTSAHKSMVIANADNVASGLNLGRTGQNQGYTGKRDLSVPALTPFYLIQPPSVDYIGLPSYYTDSGNAGSVNLNHESEISSTWKVNLRYNLIGSKNTQLVMSKTETIDNAVEYELTNTSDWETVNKESTSQIKFSYLSESKKASVEILSTLGTSSADWNSNFKNPEYGVSSVNDLKGNLEMYRVLYSQEYGPGFVGQVGLSHETNVENVFTSYGSEELAGFFSVNQSNSIVQRIDLAKKATSLDYTFLHQVKRWSLGLRLDVGNRNVFAKQLKPDNENTWLFEGIEAGFTYRYWRQTINAGYSLKENVDIKGSLAVGRKYPDSEVDVPAHSAGNIGIELKKKDGGRLRFSVFKNRSSIDDERALYGFEYLNSPFNVFVPGEVPSTTTTRGIVFFAEMQNTLKLRNTQLSSSYVETLNDDFMATSFLGNISLLHLKYGQTSRRASVNIRHSMFSGITKSDVSFRAAGSLASTNYLLNDDFFKLKVLNSEIELKGSARLSNKIRLKYATVAKAQFLLDNDANFTRWQNRLSSFATVANGQIHGELIQMATLQNGSVSNNLVVEVGADRRVSLGNKEIYFRFKIYNLFDTDIFSIESTYDFYTFSRETTSTGRFFLLTADYSL